MEAQRFPADYDGIVAGAPINAFTRYMDGILSMQQALAEPGGYVPPKKLPAIEAAIEGACARSLPMSPVLRAHFAFPSRKLAVNGLARDSSPVWASTARGSNPW